EFSGGDAGTRAIRYTGPLCLACDLDAAGTRQRGAVPAGGQLRRGDVVYCDPSAFRTVAPRARVMAEAQADPRFGAHFGARFPAADRGALDHRQPGTPSVR